MKSIKELQNIVYFDHLYLVITTKEYGCIILYLNKICCNWSITLTKYLKEDFAKEILGYGSCSVSNIEF